MKSVLDNGVEPRPVPKYPVTELLRTYLRQSRGAGLVTVGAREEQTAATPTSAQDLWDYLGDFA
jgi:hypothetical protein